MEAVTVKQITLVDLIKEVQKKINEFRQNHPEEYAKIVREVWEEEQEEKMNQKTKAERGREIAKSLPPWFNIYPVLTWDSNECLIINYEALADWFDAKQEQSDESSSTKSPGQS
jgi:hypothetical protein